MVGILGLLGREGINRGLGEREHLLGIGGGDNMFG